MQRLILPKMSKILASKWRQNLAFLVILVKIGVGTFWSKSDQASRFNRQPRLARLRGGAPGSAGLRNGKNRLPVVILVIWQLKLSEPWISWVLWHVSAQLLKELRSSGYSPWLRTESSGQLKLARTTIFVRISAGFWPGPSKIVFIRFLVVQPIIGFWSILVKMTIWRQVLGLAQIRTFPADAFGIFGASRLLLVAKFHFRNFVKFRKFWKFSAVRRRKLAQERPKIGRKNCRKTKHPKPFL